MSDSAETTAYGLVFDHMGLDANSPAGMKLTDAIRDALRASEERAENLNDDVQRIHNEKVEHFLARIAAEARVKELEALLHLIPDNPPVSGRARAALGDSHER